MAEVAIALSMCTLGTVRDTNTEDAQPCFWRLGGRGIKLEIDEKKTTQNQRGVIKLNESLERAGGGEEICHGINMTIKLLITYSDRDKF